MSSIHIQIVCVRWNVFTVYVVCTFPEFVRGLTLVVVVCTVWCRSTFCLSAVFEYHMGFVSTTCLVEVIVANTEESH